ncbi:LOW QUALITY PROTEIN: protein moonraker-like [Xenia sp. Carnegie-2017]|uniref:LOW QUALITY PROTEIN: protein moonraker-like n=1 Tax=Xenia sp. Carnegie-2017 TaxID=2897299 RepID=UPI001F046E5C|nr:LOW QUALITY PROTEIN: protein moonraker-like [Xenia sp. Carnegie-2017]
MTSTDSLNGHFYGPSSVSLGTHQDPSALVNQLQFNLRTPYSIESMKSNFEKPKPVLIEKFPSAPIHGYRSMSPILSHGVTSSPLSSLSNERLNFAVQLAKVDAKKLWKKQKEQEMIDDLTIVKTKDFKKINSTANQKKTKQIPKKVVKKESQTRVKDDDFYQRIPTQLHTESGGEQSKEIKRLEKQIQNYLKKLKDLIHKGKDEINNKEKKHFQQKKENVSVLSDDDTDQRQRKRSEEQASRSARILYTIECQIQQLEDEIRKNGRDVKERRKIQSLEGRLAAAQRAIIRALRMLINSAPLQPKNCQYYQTLFQTLTSLIQQLSDLSLLMENQDNEGTSIHKRIKKYNETKTSDPLKAFELSSNRDVNKKSLERNFPHFPLEFFDENDSTLTVDPSPDRNATLKSAVQALMREKGLEKKIGDRKMQSSSKSEKTRLKSVLLPKTIQIRRKYGFKPSEKTVKVPENLSNFKKETKSSIQKKVARQKTKTKVAEIKTKEERLH